MNSQVIDPKPSTPGRRTALALGVSSVAAVTLAGQTEVVGAWAAPTVRASIHAPSAAASAPPFWNVAFGFAGVTRIAVDPDGDETFEIPAELVVTSGGAGATEEVPAGLRFLTDTTRDRDGNPVVRFGIPDLDSAVNRDSTGTASVPQRRGRLLLDASGVGVWTVAAAIPTESSVRIPLSRVDFAQPIAPRGSVPSGFISAVLVPFDADAPATSNDNSARAEYVTGAGSPR